MNNIDKFTFVIGILLIVIGALFDLFHLGDSLIIGILGCICIYIVFIKFIFNEIERGDDEDGKY
jgi:uncharacterized membrane protein YagU involved in acid resistance